MAIEIPARVVVTLKAGLMFGLANVLCVLIFSFAWMHVKADPKVISVTGSAKKPIVSDLIVWSASISVQNPDVVLGYDQLKTSLDKTLAYLKKQGIADDKIFVSSISTSRVMKRDEKGNSTDQLNYFALSQRLTVTSNEVRQVGDVARDATTLIKEGVMIDSDAPEYLYTKLADLKVDMLVAATQDATNRARQIAENSGASLGDVVEARMGVLQINPIHSTEVSGMGNNDTSSYEKEITGVVSARFRLE